MEIRQLHYFVAVAEELHFGRAADRVGIAQPPLSRAIARLEDELGTALFERTSRRVALTPAGAVLLEEARGILGAAGTAARRVRQVGDDSQRLVLVTKAGSSERLLAELLDAYAREPGAVPVELLLCDAKEQRTILRDGRADVALLHLPWDAMDGLDADTLETSPQVAVLPAAHPLARRASLTLGEAHSIPDLPLARWPREDGTYPDGPGVEAHNLTQLFQLIALGRAATVIPSSSTHGVGPDIATVRVVDAPLITTVIAWPMYSRSRAVADLVRVAGRIRPDAAMLESA